MYRYTKYPAIPKIPRRLIGRNILISRNATEAYNALPHGNIRPLYRSKPVDDLTYSSTPPLIDTFLSEISKYLTLYKSLLL